MSDQPGLSRRAVGGLVLSGGLVGAVWATGLGVLARGVHPQVQVVGKDAWQVVLIEHGSARVLLLLGKVENEAHAATEALLTSFHQHVDVIIGEQESLVALGSANLKWRDATRIVMATSSLSAVSGRSVIPSQHLILEVGAMQLHVRQEPRGAWQSSGKPTFEWHVLLEVDGVAFVAANTLAIASAYATANVTLLIAPTLGESTETFSGGSRSLAVNANALTDIQIAPFGNDGPYLIRTFPGEPATFRIRDGRISLPDWAQSFAPGSLRTRST